VEEVEEIKGL
jgi:hypothetical protein